jgi:hypothetical protein
LFNSRRIPASRPPDSPTVSRAEKEHFQTVFEALTKATLDEHSFDPHGKYLFLTLPQIFDEGKLS